MPAEARCQAGRLSRVGALDAAHRRPPRQARRRHRARSPPGGHPHLPEPGSVPLAQESRKKPRCVLVGRGRLFTSRRQACGIFDLRQASDDLVHLLAAECPHRRRSKIRCLRAPHEGVLDEHFPAKTLAQLTSGGRTGFNVRRAIGQHLPQIQRLEGTTAQCFVSQSRASVGRVGLLVGLLAARNFRTPRARCCGWHSATTAPLLTVSAANNNVVP